jgi:hypothetical protein
MQSRARERVVAKIVTAAVSSPVVAIVESEQQLFIINEAALESQNEDAARRCRCTRHSHGCFVQYVRNA